MKKQMIIGIGASVLSAAITAPTVYAISSSSQRTRDVKVMNDVNNIQDEKIYNLRLENYQQKEMIACLYGLHREKEWENQRPLDKYQSFMDQCKDGVFHSNTFVYQKLW